MHPTEPTRLAVHVGRHAPEGLAAVLSEVAPWAEVVAAAVQEPLPEGVRAHLYTSDALPRRPEGPYAVWQLPGSEPVEAVGAVLIGEVGVREPTPGELTTCPLPWPDRARPLLPFGRSRYRMLRGLPETLITEAAPGGITWGPTGGTPRAAPDEAWPTLAALSSSVVAQGDLVWAALAWAAPTVTDTATARRLALTPDAHVLVADEPAERRRLAQALAADESWAAQLAQRGWSTARERRPQYVAKTLCRRLGLGARGVAMPSGLADALDFLGAPRDSLIRRRARQAVATLPGAVTAGWRPAERTDRAQP